MMPLFMKQASYLFNLVESDIIRNGAEWDNWKIGTTGNPEEFHFYYEAESPDEAQKTVDFLLGRRAISLDPNSTPGTFIYIVQK
jgi:hypothetical protein